MTEKGDLYVDLLSQPCRALALLIRQARLDNVKEKPISLRKGQHKTEEYKKINPSTEVPAYVSEDGWALPESVAILRFICGTQKFDDHWYPVEPRARARVDEFLAWQHVGLRGKAVPVFLAVTFHKMRTGTVNKETLKEKCGELEEALTQMEKKFLSGRDFVAGSNISVADLFGVCEIMQPILAGYDVNKRHPVIADWIKRVKAAVQPHFDDVHKSASEFAAQHQYDYEALIGGK